MAGSRCVEVVCEHRRRRRGGKPRFAPEGEEACTGAAQAAHSQVRIRGPSTFTSLYRQSTTSSLTLAAASKPIYSGGLHLWKNQEKQDFTRCIVDGERVLSARPSCQC